MRKQYSSPCLIISESFDVSALWSIELTWTQTTQFGIHKNAKRWENFNCVKFVSAKNSVFVLTLNCLWQFRCTFCLHLSAMLLLKFGMIFIYEWTFLKKVLSNLLNFYFATEHRSSAQCHTELHSVATRALHEGEQTVTVLTCAIFLRCPLLQTMKAFIGRFTWSFGSDPGPCGSWGLYGLGACEWDTRPGDPWGESPGWAGWVRGGDSRWWGGSEGSCWSPREVGSAIGEWLTVSGGEYGRASPVSAMVLNDVTKCDACEKLSLVPLPSLCYRGSFTQECLASPVKLQLVSRSVEPPLSLDVSLDETAPLPVNALTMWRKKIYWLINVVGWILSRFGLELFSRLCCRKKTRIQNSVQVLAPLLFLRSCGSEWAGFGFLTLMSSSHWQFLGPNRRFLSSCAATNVCDSNQGRKRSSPQEHVWIRWGVWHQNGPLQSQSAGVRREWGAAWGSTRKSVMWSSQLLIYPSLPAPPPIVLIGSTVVCIAASDWWSCAINGENSPCHRINVFFCQRPLERPMTRKCNSNLRLTQIVRQFTNKSGNRRISIVCQCLPAKGMGSEYRSDKDHSSGWFRPQGSHVGLFKSKLFEPQLHTCFVSIGKNVTLNFPSKNTESTHNG